MRALRVTNTEPSNYFAKASLLCFTQCKHSNTIKLCFCFYTFYFYRFRLGIVALTSKCVRVLVCRCARACVCVCVCEACVCMCVCVRASVERSAPLWWPLLALTSRLEAESYGSLQLVLVRIWLSQTGSQSRLQLALLRVALPLLPVQTGGNGGTQLVVAAGQ